MRHQLPILAAFLMTTACQVNQQANDNAAVEDLNDGNALPANDVMPSANVVDPNVPPPPHMDPDAPPAAADNMAQGAVRRALEYCDALATRRFGDAYRLWSDNGRASGLTESEFAAKFAGVNISDCQLGAAGEIQGAAGSIYIEVPTTIRGTTKAGRPLRIEGPIILRRVNDVPGSTAEQRRWHIARAEFPAL